MSLFVVQEQDVAFAMLALYVGLTARFFWRKSRAFTLSKYIRNLCCDCGSVILFLKLSFGGLGNISFHGKIQWTSIHFHIFLGG